MDAHKLSVTALSLGAALAFGTPAKSADLPKEGTFSSTYSGVTTVKASPIGKERLLLTGEGYGLSVGEGILDHMTWHCLGLGDFTNGVGLFRGNCVGTDPTGDQVVTNFSTEKAPLDQKIVPGSFTFTTGTGKYAGITGSATFESDASRFRSPEGGPTFDHLTNHGGYKPP
jgi:hypothetical protein